MASIVEDGIGSGAGGTTSSPLNVDGLSSGVFAPNVSAFSEAFNGTTWDRRYNNTQGTLLASAARTATVNSPVQTNFNARGVYVWLHLTAVPGGADTVTLAIQAIDPVSGAARSLLTATGGNVINGASAVPADYVFAVYPGMVDSAGALANISASPLPRAWQVHLAHSGVTSFTYSVSYAYIL